MWGSDEKMKELQLVFLFVQLVTYFTETGKSFYELIDNDIRHLMIQNELKHFLLKKNKSSAKTGIYFYRDILICQCGCHRSFINAKR